MSLTEIRPGSGSGVHGDWTSGWAVGLGRDPLRAAGPIRDGFVAAQQSGAENTTSRRNPLSRAPAHWPAPDTSYPAPLARLRCCHQRSGDGITGLVKDMKNPHRNGAGAGQRDPWQQGFRKPF